MNTVSLENIVEHDYLNAYILDTFGIDFFKYPCLSLEDVCKRLRIDVSKIIQNLQNPYKPESVITNMQLNDYSVTELVRLLKSTHRQFVRRQLPFMNKLINNVPKNHLSSHYIEVAEILQMSFQLFAEDFIHHILDEEKKVFDYLIGLEYALIEKNKLHSLFFSIKKTTLLELSRQHKDDDEMKTIRDLTQNYSISQDMPLVIRVLYGELMRFDADLQRHAFIENEFLFPQGDILEKKLLETIPKLALLN